MERFGAIIYVFKAAPSSFLRVFKGLWFPIGFSLFCIGLILLFGGYVSAVVVEVVFVVAGFVFVRAHFPRCYVLTTMGVVVRRLLGDVFIPYGGVLRVWRASVDEVFRDFRVESWFLTHAALWVFKQLMSSRVSYGGETVYFYATDLERTVIIECCGGEKYYISPEEPERFLKVIGIFLGEKALPTKLSNKFGAHVKGNRNHIGV